MILSTLAIIGGFFYFLVAIYLAFFIPGNLLFSRSNFTSGQKIGLSIVVGMVLWGFQGLVFGYLGIRWMSYVYLAICFISYVLIFAKTAHIYSNIFSFFQKLDLFTTILVILGIVFQLLSVLLLGIQYPDGLYFCCATPDSLFHIALTNSLIHSFPPAEPAMAGIIVQNYHYFANLIIADLVRIFHLPLIYSLFQYSTIFMSGLWAAMIIFFSDINNLPKNFKRWAVFLLFFSGDVVFVLLFILGKGINFNVDFIHNPMQIWSSPPRIFAIVVFSAGLVLFSYWIKRKELYVAVLISLLFGSLISFKVYVGIFALFGLGVVMLYYFFQKKIYIILPFVLAFFVAALLYLPVNSNAGGLLYTGTWRFEDFIVYPAFGLDKWELARRIYAEHSNWLRVIQYEVTYAVLFFVVIFGTNIVSIFQTKKSLAFFPKEIHMLLIPSIVLCLILGSFFIQKIGGTNTSQFIITVMMIIPLYTALALTYWMVKIPKPFRYCFIAIIVLLSIPRVLHVGSNQIPIFNSRGGYFVSKNEQSAMNFIAKNTPKDSVFLFSGTNPDKEAQTYLFSFLAGRSIYLGGTTILKDHGVSVKKRQVIQDMVFANPQASSLSDALADEHIDYIYSTKNDPPIPTYSFLKPVYKNATITVLEVDKSILHKQ